MTIFFHTISSPKLSFIIVTKFSYFCVSLHVWKGQYRVIRVITDAILWRAGSHESSEHWNTAASSDLETEAGRRIYTYVVDSLPFKAFKALKLLQ